MMKLYCEKCKKVCEAEIPEGIHEYPCPDCASPIAVPEGPLTPGAVLGDFLIEKELAGGGMGKVFRARQISLDRPVALKVLHEKFAHNKEYVDGLFREARAAAKLTHPNIVQAYAVGEENGIYYFAMEFIRGETFKQILKKEHILPFEQAAKVVKEIAGALQAAWTEQKLVHQDIKPDNIMLDANGFAKLSDLGLARHASASDQVDEDGTEVLGTPQYISPEQLTGVPTDIRSDIYSLGATFYQFVTGQFPYPGKNAEEMAKLHVEGKLTPPKEINPQLPDKLNAIICKMMARHSADRYQDGEELIKDLDSFLLQNSAQGAAVPKLSLKLPKMGAAAIKPATPAKPVIPAKPATPAKPVIPVKPATPAKPVIPAKPATPAKPIVPAEPAKPAAEAAPAQQSAAAAPVPEKTKKNPGRKKLFWILGISAAAVIVLFAATLLTLYFTGKAKKLPGKLQLAGDWIVSLTEKKTPAAQTETQEKQTPGKTSPDGKKLADGKQKTVTPSPAVPKPLPPPPPPKPVTRSKLLLAVDKALADYRTAPDSNWKKFLEEGDRIFKEFGSPVTKEEETAMEKFHRAFALEEEAKRVSPFRKKTLQVLKDKQAKIAADAEEKRKKAEAERKAETERRAAREQDEAEARRIGAAQAAEAREQEAKLRTQLAQIRRKLVDGFLLALKKQDESLWQNVYEETKRQLDECRNINVPPMKRDLMIKAGSGFRTEANSELKNLFAFYEKISQTDLDSLSSVYVDKLGLIKLKNIMPGKMQYVKEGKTKVYPLKRTKYKELIFERIRAEWKDSKTPFHLYYSLWEGKRPEEPRNTKNWPSFWKKYLNDFYPAK